MAETKQDKTKKSSNGSDIVPFLAIGAIGIMTYEKYKEYVHLIGFILVLGALSFFLGRFLVRKRKENVEAAYFLVCSTIVLLSFLSYAFFDPTFGFQNDYYGLIKIYGFAFILLCLNLAFFKDLFKDRRLYLKRLGTYGEDHVYLGRAASLIKENNLDLNSKEVQKTFKKGHQMVFGASGSGKTFSVLRPQIAYAIKEGQCVFIIDPKGDVEFRDAVYSYCKFFGREDDFCYFSLSNPEISDQFNPFKTKSTTEAKDLIISVTDWSEPHYKKMAEVHLLRALMGMENPTLSKIINNLPGKKELSGLLADLNIMQMSAFGPLIDLESAPGLLDFYKENSVCFFSLDVQAYPETAIRLGRIILGSLMGVSNYTQTSLNPAQRKPTTIVVDEFGSFVSDTFINFLNKARSSNFRLIMATQSLGDLKRSGTEQLSQILDSTMVKIVLRMGDPDSVEYCSRIFGTQDTLKETRQVDTHALFLKETGLGSERLGQSFVVPPSEIKKIGRGVGFVTTSDPFSISKVDFVGCTLQEEYLETYQRQTDLEDDDLPNSEKVPVKKESGTVQSSDFSIY